MDKKNGNRKKKNDNKRQLEMPGNTSTQASEQPKQDKPIVPLVKPPNKALDHQVRKMLRGRAEREEMLINEFEQSKAVLYKMIEREGGMGIDCEAFENLKRELKTEVKPGTSKTLDMAAENIGRIQENCMKLSEQFCKQRGAKAELEKRKHFRDAGSMRKENWEPRGFYTPESPLSYITTVRSYPRTCACHIFGELLKKFEEENGCRLPCDVCGR